MKQRRVTALTTLSEDLLCTVSIVPAASQPQIFDRTSTPMRVRCRVMIELQLHFGLTTPFRDRIHVGTGAAITFPNSSFNRHGNKSRGPRRC